MDMTDSTTTNPARKMSMNGWACASVVVLLLAGAVFSALFARAAFIAFHRARKYRDGTVTSIIIKSPTFITGPAIEMAIPAGADLTSAHVNTDAGNWWYENANRGHLHLLIAASRISLRQADVNNDYFLHVIRLVERSAGDRITAMGTIQETKAGSYSGRQARFDIQSSDGKAEHAVALLIRRESDDLLVALYGDESASDEVDRAAAEMFRSLHPQPTPPQYDVHSADDSSSSRDRAFLNLKDAIIRI